MTAYADVASQDSLIVNQPYDGGEVILNYQSVFAAYYTDAKERYDSTGKTFVDFETFCENYYTSGQDIAAYTESYFGRANSISTYSSSDSSASSDAEYMLSKNKYDKTPASEFKSVPAYTEYLYANIRNGDLVCETDAIFDAGHTAVITDINHDSDYGRYYQTIEAVAGGVQYGFLDDDRVVKYGVMIYRARGYSQSMHSNLLYFLEQQLGKTYMTYGKELHKNTKTMDVKYINF